MTAEEYLKGNSFSDFDPELNGKSTCVELITALTAIEMAKREERERLMKHLIDKSALVAEIESLIDGIYAGRPFDSLSSEQQTALWYVKSIMSSIDTLEVKEVDEEPYVMSDKGKFTTTTK